MEKVVKSGVEEANSSSEPTVGSQMVPDLETVYDSVRRLENSQEKISSQFSKLEDLLVSLRSGHGSEAKLAARPVSPRSDQKKIERERAFQVAKSHKDFEEMRVCQKSESS